MRALFDDERIFLDEGEATQRVGARWAEVSHLEQCLKKVDDAITDVAVHLHVLYILTGGAKEVQLV